MTICRTVSSRDLFIFLGFSMLTTKFNAQVYASSIFPRDQTYRASQLMCSTSERLSDKNQMPFGNNTDDPSLLIDSETTTVGTDPAYGRRLKRQERISKRTARNEMVRRRREEFLRRQSMIFRNRFRKAVNFLSEEGPTNGLKAGMMVFDFGSNNPDQCFPSDEVETTSLQVQESTSMRGAMNKTFRRVYISKFNVFRYRLTKLNKNWLLFRIPMLEMNVAFPDDMSTKRRTDEKKEYGTIQNYHQDDSMEVSRTRIKVSKFLVMAESKTSIALDVSSTLRLIAVLWNFSGEAVISFVGTLRLIAPLVVARRALLGFGNILIDYARGRYYRKTYTRVEKIFIRYYEAPAAARGIYRTASQVLVLILLSRIIRTIVVLFFTGGELFGISILSFPGAFIWLNATIWGAAVVQGFLTAWFKPLRIEISEDSFKRNRFLDIPTLATRPWHIFHWLSDPSEWLSMRSMLSSRQGRPNSKDFIPNPLLFPATWIPLRVFQVVAMARILSKDPSNYSPQHHDEAKLMFRVMTQFLLQIACGDEWFRILFFENRVGLGLVTACAHLISIITVVATSSMMDRTATLFMIPLALSVLVSALMNLCIFKERMDADRKYITMLRL